MFKVDKLLTGEKFRTILKDLANGKHDSIKLLINDFAPYVEDEFSDAFVHKMVTICRFLIDLGEYEYLAEIIKLCAYIGTYENVDYEGEECVVSYAIRKIDDQDKLKNVIEACKGGDLTVFFYEYATPSKVAIDCEKYDILKLIFDNKLSNEEMGYGHMTALQYAAQNRKYKLAELLLQLHHNPNLYGVVDIPPIALAADANDFKMAKLLIQYGANVSATDGNGKTSINYARSDKMIEIFEEKGAVRENLQMRCVSRVIANIKDNGVATAESIEGLKEYKSPVFGNTDDNIILLAAKYGDVDTLNQLAPFFEQVDPDKLIYAVFDGYKLDGNPYRKDVDKLIALTNILVEAGVHREVSGGLLSPFHVLSLYPEMFLRTSDEKAFVLFNNIEKLGYRLDENDCLGRNRFHDAVEYLNKTLITYCLERGMQYKDLDTEKVSAVWLLLSYYGNYEFKEENSALLEDELERLLANGCNINHQDEMGNTPLHKLVNGRIVREYPVKLLVKNHANLSLENLSGEKPYDIAVRRLLPERILALLKS